MAPRESRAPSTGPRLPGGNPWITASGAGRLLVRVRVSPGAPRDEVVGPDARGDLKVKVSAPPEAGKANAAVEALIAVRLGARKGEVSVIAGHTSRSKRVEVRSPLAADEAASLLLQ